MNKREFLKLNALATGAVLFAPITGWAFAPAADTFTLPNLDYGFEALEPHIDTATMQIHHGKHHAAYVTNLNKAVAGSAFENKTILDILPKLTSKTPAALRNNGGGHFNHSLFWKILSPKANTQPGAELTSAINGVFGSLDKLKETMTESGKGLFGSGWLWLSVDKNKKLFVSTTPNQDNPLMSGLVKQVGTPILGIDVWEHAYYLKYQNKRADYLTAIWNVIQWEEVTKNFQTAISAVKK
ncbi:MAG: superoxide dismutase [Microscillaceae bacterium]|nr:superoxide dismutase [Microscillaceae bacterium]